MAEDKPSFLTSTTAIGFLVVVIGAVGYAWWTKDGGLVTKLVDMIIPAFLMSKGIKLGQNGGSNGIPETPASGTPPATTP